MLCNKKMDFLTFAKRFDNGTPCIRHIGMIWNEKSNRKAPKPGNSDHNNYTMEQIQNDRGTREKSLYGSIWFAFHIGLIYHPVKKEYKLVLVDFDNYKGKPINELEDKEKILSSSGLFQTLKALNCWQSTTKKGIHLFVWVKDMKKYTKQDKVGNEEDYEIDLITFQNNVWSPEQREIQGNDVFINWEDISCYFNETKMNFAHLAKPKPVPKKPTKTRDEKIDKDSSSESDSDDDDDGEIKEMLFKIKERDSAGKINLNCNDWVGIGHALCNHFKGSLKGLEMFDYFSKQYEQHYDRVGLKSKWKEIKKQYKSGSSKAGLNYIRKLADHGYNEFVDIYEKKGERGVAKEMNKYVMFNRSTAEYIVLNGNRYYVHKSSACADYFRDKTYFNDKGKTENPFSTWNSSEYRRKVDGIDFDPAGEQENIYNLWKGYKIKHDDCKDLTNAEEESSPFFEHIKHIWCKGDLNAYAYVIKKLAYIIQFPHLKSGVNVVIKSEEGAGKSLVLVKFGQIIGAQHFLSTSNPNRVFGDFNGCTEGKKCLVLEECFFGGDKKQANIMKDVTTSDKKLINKKNKEVYEINDYTECFMFSNEDWICPVESGSRRYYMLDCDNKYAGRHDCPEKKDYFDKIIKCPAKAIAKVLYEMDLTGYNPRDFAKTELFQEQVEHNFTTVQKWWFQCLKEDRILPNEPFEGYNHIYSKDMLFKLYDDAKHGTYGKKVDRSSFFKQLFKLINDDKLGVYVPDDSRLTRTYPDMDEPDNKDKEVVIRKHCIVFPDIGTCRKVWNKKQDWDYTWETKPESEINDD